MDDAIRLRYDRVLNLYIVRKGEHEIARAETLEAAINQLNEYFAAVESEPCCFRGEKSSDKSDKR